FSNIPGWTRRYVACFLYMLALVSTVVGLAESSIMVEAKDKEYSNIRIIFLVDVSRSMVYAEDVPPNRLEATRKQIKDFYDSLDGIYEVSILPFAGDVNPYFCPFTKSKGSFNSMLKEMDWRS